MTTTTETPTEQYRCLMSQYEHLRRIHPDRRTFEETATYQATCAQLAEIDATPPAGYTLPAAAARLVEHARAHQWQARVQWPRPDSTDDPSVKVMVGRLMTPAERDEYGLGDRWQYFLTWSSRDCPPGRLRLFGSGIARTPDQPADHGAPSVRAITAVIAARTGTPA
jgi:hypothetical protein